MGNRERETGKEKAKKKGEGDRQGRGNMMGKESKGKTGKIQERGS